MNKENLPQVIKENIFVKIKNWFKKLFLKKGLETDKVVEGIKDNMRLEENNFIKDIKVEDTTEILELQKDLKQNKIKISDLTDIQLQKMIELYKSQIEKKKIKLRQYRKRISNYN